MPVSVTPPWRTVVVSPHFDDAALSLTGLLPTLPGPVAVVTVHGGSPAPGLPVSGWDALCGFSSAVEAYRARRAEDARSCKLLGAEQVLVDHPDGPYVGEGDEPAGLDALLRSLAPGTRVLVPLATNQPDHEAVRLRTQRVLAAAGAPEPWVYADLPYTGHLPEWGTPGAGEALAASEDWGPLTGSWTAPTGSPSATSWCSPTSSGRPSATLSCAMPPSSPRSPPSTVPSCPGRGRCAPS